ncbi:unnamed protein product [Didymodactylos carnosus]|uniref:Uncharacterized protein n=1 Tax=Didymodactylos carnosus TaxID=1234261 RepID=A0A815KRH8_9BILA|nr:unnamed protein product [Didymodactylos carnosus]CAF4293945.1 unnamed protein product [Didymodactylos carnosus]
MKYLLCTLALFISILTVYSRNECECEARTDTTVPVKVKDFGVIDQCGVGLFSTCSCTDKAMVECGTNCEKKVQEWVKSGCSGGLLGMKRGTIMSYHHGDCQKGYGSKRYTCP